MKCMGFQCWSFAGNARLSTEQAPLWNASPAKTARWGPLSALSTTALEAEKAGVFALGKCTENRGPQASQIPYLQICSLVFVFTHFYLSPNIIWWPYLDHLFPLVCWVRSMLSEDDLPVSLRGPEHAMGRRHDVSRGHEAAGAVVLRPPPSSASLPKTRDFSNMLQIITVTWFEVFFYTNVTKVEIEACSIIPCCPWKLARLCWSASNDLRCPGGDLGEAAGNGGQVDEGRLGGDDDDHDDQEESAE